MSPIYDYRCARCGRTREMSQSITDDRLIKCECGYWMEREIPRTSVVFKGEGWAKKDREKSGGGK